jgi:hypothetical protein
MPRPTLRGLLLPAPPLDDLEPVSARPVLKLLSSLRPGRSLATRAENLYVTVFSIAVILGVTWALARRAGTLFVDVAHFYHFVVGTPLVLLLFLGVLRYSTVQGFVTFSEADCFYILPAPLRRSDLVLPRLVTATVLLGLAGAITGLLAILTAKGAHSGARIGEGVLAGLALGVLLVAASWHVQRLRWATAWVMRLTIPLLGGVILLAFAQNGGHAAKFAGLWSGPWGWGILPLAAGAPRYAVVALGALCVLALAGAVSVWRTAGDCSLDGFRVRARTRSQVVASLYAFDYRTVGLAARGDKTQNWQGRIRLRPPARPILTVPWRGAVALLRSPVRLVWGIVLAGAGVYLVGLQPLRQGALWAGAVVLYLAASSLLEPLRQEVDTPGAAKVLLPWRFEKVLWLHCLVPAGIMIVAGLLTVAGGLTAWSLRPHTADGLAAGTLSPHAAATLVALIIPLTFFVVLAAALSARRGGRVSSNLVNTVSMDTTGLSSIFIFVQIGIWAILSVAGTVFGVWALTHWKADFGVLLPVEFAVFAVLAFAMQRALLMPPGPSIWEKAQGTESARPW